MKVKDKITSWYIKNVYLPQNELIQNPGFICEKMGNRNFHIREVAIPEFMILALESRVKENKFLYAVGKKFGFLYAQSSDFPTISNTNREKFLESAHTLVKYIEAISYGQDMQEKIDYDKRIFSLTAKDYIVCSKNGKGFIFSSGGIAGIWAWFVEDKSVEGVQAKCQGRGNEECEIICAPIKQLRSMGYRAAAVKTLENLDMDSEYKQFNAIRETKWASKSLQKLIDSGFFKFQYGQVTYEGEKFFLCESSFMYILEKELKKIKRGKEILWDISFDFGKRIAEKSGAKDAAAFAGDMFPALGFGDMLVITKKGKYEIFAAYFPWTKWYAQADFTMFRGMLSGAISALAKRKVMLRGLQKDVTNGYLSLHITE